MIVKNFNEWLLENEETEPKYPQTHKEVQVLLNKWKVKNYTINDDLTVDVIGDVDLNDKIIDFGFKKIPIKFKNVTGHFMCTGNDLESLEGLSEGFTATYFHCNYNKLDSLISLPKNFKVEHFFCTKNELTSLEGLQKSTNSGVISFVYNRTVSQYTLELLGNDMFKEGLSWEQAIMKHFKDIPNEDWIKMSMPIKPSAEFQEWIKNMRGAIVSKRLGL